MNQRRSAALFAAAVVVSGILAAGCGGEPAPKPPVAEVKTVQAYGVALGPQASPQEVTFVLLRSIADDYAAARAKDRKAERQAQELTFSLAAPKIMEQRLVETANELNPDLHKKDLGAERDERLFKTVHFWGPIVGHYLASFKDIDLPTLQRDSWVALTPDGKTAEVFMPVAHDPAEKDPAKMETATIKIELNREAGQGGEEYWRISRVRFLGRQFSAPSLPLTVQAYGIATDASATPEQVATMVIRSLGEMAGAAKSGNKDVGASAMYRVLCLVNQSQAQAAAGPGKKLDAVVQEWAKQVGGSPAVSNVGPQQMRPTMGAGTAAVLTDLDGRTITVDLTQQNVGGQTYWRIADVKTQGAATTSSAPAK